MAVLSQGTEALRCVPFALSARVLRGMSSIRHRPCGGRTGGRPTHASGQFGSVAAFLRVALLVALACLDVANCGELRAQVSQEYDVKAVFLFNFAKFVDWPREAFPQSDTPLTIGVLGVDPFGRALDDVVRGEEIRGRPVFVERFRRVQDVRHCHILFISASESRLLPQILEELKGRPILTVSDMDQFVARGGIVKLHLHEEKVRLRVNHEAAKAARLGVSSKLLRVAEIVTPSSPD